MSILVVVDMQTGFRTTKSIVPNVEKVIRQAITKRQVIIFLELSNNTWGNIYQELVDAVEHYPLAFMVRKADTDGSLEVWEFLKQLKYHPELITFCGVNRCACVRQTIVGLRRHGYQHKVVIVKDACNCNCMHYKCYENYFGYPIPEIV